LTTFIRGDTMQL